MKVLVACEFSGVVRDAFSRRGHDAWSCDILPTESPGNHIQDDVLKHLDEGWDLMIAHPPCTYLSYVGTRHWNLPGREQLRLAALGFFIKLYEANIPKVCIENPLGYASKAYKKYDQIIHPYYFGDSAQKRTCLWLRGLPLLAHPDPRTIEKPKAIYTLKTNGKKIHWTEANHGGKVRSKFWPGIAEAMAEQWCDTFTF
jgi:hypothetical protein